MSEQIHRGNRGEILCEKLITEYCGRQSPLFQVSFLGERHPTIDYFVRLVDEAGAVTSHFFFVQIKATASGYNASGDLRISVSAKDMARLRAFPAPTYIVGIDLVSGRGFLRSASGTDSLSLSSLSTHYELNCGNLELLWHEVHDFWEAHGTKPEGSAFT